MVKLCQMSKPIFTLVHPNDTRKLCSFNVHNELFGDLTVTTREYNDGINRFITELKNKPGKLFGKEIFSLEQNSDNMFGYFMEVGQEYRNKNFRFGEILRLSSIIEMIENKIKTLNIYSKDTAIYFHSKYKFKPDIHQFDTRNKALESIINNPQKGFETFIEKAVEILKKIKNTDSPELQRTLRNDTNILTREYLQQVLKTEGSRNTHPFDYGMDMTLTRETILENKDFFNALFKKHGIDYEI